MALVHLVLGTTTPQDAIIQINATMDLATVAMPVSGGTFTGNFAMTSGTNITLGQDATQPLHPVTKQVFDAHASHLDPIVAAIIFGG